MLDLKIDLNMAIGKNFRTGKKTAISSKKDKVESTSVENIIQNQSYTEKISDISYNGSNVKKLKTKISH